MTKKEILEKMADLEFELFEEATENQNSYAMIADKLLKDAMKKIYDIFNDELEC